MEKAGLDSRPCYILLFFPFFPPFSLFSALEIFPLLRLQNASYTVSSFRQIYSRR